jgi:Endonuclease NucS
MSYQSDAFKKYYVGQGLRENGANYYDSFLKKIDFALKSINREGLDEAIEKDLNGLRTWAKTTEMPPFDKRPSNPRSVINKYLQFRLEIGDTEEESDFQAPPETEALEPSGQAFQLEREMQGAVRNQITNLERGLQIVDGGNERRVTTGSIDIVAKDERGSFVVIELKAGNCPRGSLEQVMGYAKDLKDEEAVADVRMILIAKSFPDRILAAADFVPKLKLVIYDYSLTFKEAQ